MPKQIEFGGQIHEFPDDFSDSDIAAALSSEPQFPGMPQGLQRKGSPFDTFSQPKSSLNQFQDTVPETSPPPLLKRPDKPPSRFMDTMQYDEKGNVLAFPHFEGSTDAEGNPHAGSLGALALGGAAALGLARGGGAVQGGQLAYKKSGGSIPATIAGAVSGAVMPGVATAADAVDTLGPGGGVMAGGLALAVKKYGLETVAKFLHVPVPVAKAIATAAGLVTESGAKNIPAEVKAATTAARVEKALVKGEAGLPPTDPTKLEEALRASLQNPRVQMGAERVGRPLGLTKEEIRRQTGPILGEGLGEASPVLPKKILTDIIDKVKSIPKTNQAARIAYVNSAKDLKTRAQVETVRRTLERLGLLLPVGAGIAASQQEGY